MTWETLSQVEATYQKNLDAFLRRDTEELPAILPVAPLSLNTCARINALIQYGKGIVVEVAVDDFMFPVKNILIHPHYNDMLLVSSQDNEDLYVTLPGYTIFSLRFYEQKKEEP